MTTIPRKGKPGHSRGCCRSSASIGKVNDAVAGSGGQSPVGALDTALLERVLGVDLTGVAWLCRAAIPHMLRARTRLDRQRVVALYIASKGGRNALTRSARPY